jgi:hypothetical protein
VPAPGRTIEMEKDRRITPAEYYELLKATGPKVKNWILKNQERLSKMSEQDAQDELSEAATKIRKFELVRMKMKLRGRELQLKPAAPPKPPKPEAPPKPESFILEEPSASLLRQWPRQHSQGFRSVPLNDTLARVG